MINMPQTILNFAVPLLFIVAVVYGALEVSGVFRNKGVKAIISVAIAFMGMTYSPLAVFINEVLPYAAIFFMVIFFLGFLFSFFRRGAGKDYVLIVIILGIFLLLLARTESDVASLLSSWTNITTQNLMALLGLGLVIVILSAAYKIGQQ